MPIFRKKPVEVEAVQFLGFADERGTATRNPWPVEWTTGATREWFRDGQYLAIPTLEGTHNATPGDWIIRGVKGEFYPCKPDIFAATYEQVTEKGG